MPWKRCFKNAKTTRYSLTLGNDALRKIHHNLFKNFNVEEEGPEKINLI
jgi:hypothetical protein